MSTIRSVGHPAGNNGGESEFDDGRVALMRRLEAAIGRQDIQLAKSPLSRPYLVCRRGQVPIRMYLDDQRFPDFLTELAWTELGVLPSTQDIGAVRRCLAGMAAKLFESVIGDEDVADALRTNPLIAGVAEYMFDLTVDLIELGPAEFWQLLRNEAKRCGRLTLQGNEFPKGPNAFGVELRRPANLAILLAMRIEVKVGKRQGKRFVALKRLDSSPSGPTPPATHGTSSTNSPPHFDLHLLDSDSAVNSLLQNGGQKK